MLKKLTVTVLILCSSITYSQTSYDNPIIYKEDSSSSYLTFSINIGAATSKAYFEEFSYYNSYNEEFKPVSHTFYNELFNNYSADLTGEFSYFFPNSFFGVSLGARCLYDKYVYRGLIFDGGSFEKGQISIGAHLGPSFNIKISDEFFGKSNLNFSCRG